VKLFDVVLLTKKDFYKPKNPDWYAKQVLQEDNLLSEALKRKGLKAGRTWWDNPDFDFSETKIVVFRAIWDYFHRFKEFSEWLKKTEKKTRFINSPEIVYKNIDKHYLLELKNSGINIPPTLFISKNSASSLKTIFQKTEWKEAVLKPVVSGAGRHTYKINEANISDYEVIFKKLIYDEDLMLQEFQYQITTKGEIAFIIINGKFTHAVLKKAKEGDFRVQDDFGGTVHNYTPTNEEIKFAEQVVKSCNPRPIYARVDVFFDNLDKPAVSELELTEPELWFRFHPPAADLFAETLKKLL
jgi:glutathione synthase/RimK-type ligase-like ATP-grasp enzyme